MLTLSLQNPEGHDFGPFGNSTPLKVTESNYLFIDYTYKVSGSEMESRTLYNDNDPNW